jgi:hypothetical protein
MVARMGEIRDAYKILFGQTEKKRSLALPLQRGYDNNKKDLKEIGYATVDQILTPKDRHAEGLFSTIRKDHVHKNS